MQYKVLFKIIAIIILFTIVIVFPAKVYSSWADDANDFLSKADDSAKVDETKLKKASNSIYSVLSSIGMIISVVVGIALGIIYMMSSAVDKAKVKESIVPYLIGCVIIFGAFGIWKIIINTFGDI